MKLVRPVAVAAAMVALVGAAVPAAGTSSTNAAGRTEQTCGLPEYVTGPEVVLGRFTEQSAAETLRAQAVSEGFVNAAIELGCNEFRVVVRGFDTWDTGVALQAEASRGFSATLECYQAVDKLGELEVVFGHGQDRAAAEAVADQAASEGFRGVQLENDPCGGYEVMLKGATDEAQAEALANEVRTAGFEGAIERS